MSHSKFIMAQRLHEVQKRLMGKELNFNNFDELLTVIFEECEKENLTFWFNFHEDYCVLNLRDVQHENYELNIRHAYVGIPFTGEHIQELKLYLLQNTFLLIKESVSGFQPPTMKAADTPILEGPMPEHIKRAIERIKDKGVPVTPETIRNHLPTGQMSTSCIMECNKYLKEMEDSQ